MKLDIEKISSNYHVYIIKVGFRSTPAVEPTDLAANCPGTSPGSLKDCRIPPSTWPTIQ